MALDAKTFTRRQLDNKTTVWEKSNDSGGESSLGQYEVTTRAEGKRCVWKGSEQRRSAQINGQAQSSKQGKNGAEIVGKACEARWPCGQRESERV